MRLAGLVVCAFLQQCILGMDQGELPDLSNMRLSQTIIKRVMSTAERKEAPPKSSRQQRSPLEDAVREPKCTNEFDEGFLLVLLLEMGLYKTDYKVYNIQYELDALRMLSEEPIVLTEVRAINHNCHDIEQEVQLQRTTERQSSWETGVSNTKTTSKTESVSMSIEASIPFVSVSLTSGRSLTTEYSNTKILSNSNSLKETISNSLKVTIKVPPNHSCLVKMTGKSLKFDVPYKACLTIYPKDAGRSFSKITSGTFHGLQVGEIEAVAERCKPIPGAAACRG